MDSVSGYSDGTIAAVGVAFGKFLGVFFPSISSSNWILHFWKVPPIRVGPMILGNMDVGLNTQNLIAILVVVALSVINIFGVKTGALIQKYLPPPKSLLCWDWAYWAFSLVGTHRLLPPISMETSGTMPDWARSTPCRWGWRTYGDGRYVDDSRRGASGSLFSADAWNNVTFTAGEVKNPNRNLPLSLALGTGVVITLYIVCNFIYLNVLPLDGIS